MSKILSGAQDALLFAKGEKSAGGLYIKGRHFHLNDEVMSENNFGKITWLSNENKIVVTWNDGEKGLFNPEQFSKVDKIWIV